jgi:hypothetical protein
LKFWIIAIKKINPSLSLSNFLLVLCTFSFLSYVFRIKNNQSLSCSSTWSALLNINILRFHIEFFEELYNFIKRYSERETIHYKSSFLIFWCHLIIESYCSFRISVITKFFASLVISACSWKKLRIITIRHRIQLNSSFTNISVIQSINSLLSLIRRLKKDCTKTILTSIWSKL